MSQLSFFSEPQKVTSPNIKGLEYRADYLTPSQESAIISELDKNPWLDDLSRRVQHYGWKYNYKIRSLDWSLRIGALPPILHSLALQLAADGLISVVPDQVIVNEYLPGQGIANHIDCEPCFGDTIISISLNSDISMDFVDSENNLIPIWLERRSLVALKDDCRYFYKHGIAKRTSDMHSGVKVKRTRRVSLTFRKVIIPS